MQQQFDGPDSGDALFEHQLAAGLQRRRYERFERERRHREHRPPPERLHDPVSFAERTADSLRHDGAIAVLFPRKSAEHIRRTDAQPDQLESNGFWRLLRNRGHLDCQREHRGTVQPGDERPQLADDYARRSLQSTRRRQGFVQRSTFSAPAIGSNFSFTQTTLDIAKFFPILKDATLGVHGAAYNSTGVIPPSSLFYVLRSADARL